MGANVRDSKVSTGHGPTLTATRPTFVAGDQMWAIHFTDVGLTGMTAPGWTAAGSREEDGLAVKVWRKTATGEPSTYSFGQGVNAEGTVHVFSIPGASATINAKVTFALNFASTLVTPNVTPASATHLEIRAGVLSLTGGTDTVALTAPAGYTGRGSGQSPQAFLASAAASKQLSSSAPSGAKSFGFTPSGIRFGLGVSISIASADVVPDVPPIPADAPGQGDALYVFEFRRLFGGFLGNLDVKGPSFEKRINRRGQLQPGNFTGSYVIANEDDGDLVAALVPRDPADLTRGAGVIVCDIWRAGDHWGRYWMIGSEIAKQRRQTPVLQLSGVTMDAYLQYVNVEEALGPFENEDRVEIARSIILHMQGQEHADIGLILQSGECGHTLTRTYEAFQGQYGGPVADTTAGVDGFEWMVNTQLGASSVETHWVWGNPLGDQAGTPHTFTEAPGGGEILDWRIGQTPLTRGSRWRARGDSVSTDASTSAAPLLSDAYESPHLATGLWPRIDRIVDRPGVTDLDTLNKTAQQLAASAGGAPHVFSITVLLGEEPTIHPNKLGDAAWIVLTNEYFKRVNGGAGLNERRRILGMRVIPTGRENGRDEAELYIDDQAVE